MAPVAQQYWSVDDAAAASVLEHLEQMQTKHGPLPPPPSPVNAQHCNGRDFAGLFGPPLSQHDPPHEPQRIGWGNGTKRGGSGAGLGDISDAAPRLGPARPVQSYTRLGSTRCHSHALASIPRWGRPVWLPRPACARNRCESEKGVAGKEQRRGGHSDAALYPEMLGRRRTQAGVIIRTDSQRNVSRGNRALVGLFPAAKLPTRFLKFFGTPWAIRMGPAGGKHRPVRVGSPRRTIPGGGKPGRRAAHTTSAAGSPPHSLSDVRAFLQTPPQEGDGFELAVPRSSVRVRNSLRSASARAATE